MGAGGNTHWHWRTQELNSSSSSRDMCRSPKTNHHSQTQRITVSHHMWSYLHIFVTFVKIATNIHKSSQIQVSDAGSGWPRWNGGIRHHSQHLKVQRSIEGSSSRQNQGKNCKNGKDGKVSGIWIKWHVACVHHVQMPEHLKIPTPIEGEGGGGTRPTCRIPLFLLGNPGIVIQPLEWNCKVTFLNKPWELVRKYLRLAPEELSASMITAAQFFGGMPSLHMCCFSLTCA